MIKSVWGVKVDIEISFDKYFYPRSDQLHDQKSNTRGKSKC